MSEIIYCKKCHNKKRVMSYEKAQEKLQQKFEDYEIIDQCMSTCGIGKKQFFMQKDDELIMKNSFEELIEE